MIKRKSPREIELMREAGKILAGTLEAVAALAKPKVSTQTLDEAAARFILSKGGIPAFKGYRGYPANICVSVNEEVVHGIPGKRLIKEHDIVSIDIGVSYKNYFADAAITVPVGQISPQAQKLVDVTRESLNRAIAVVRSGVPLSAISSAVQNYVEANGFSVVRDLVGHGIGSAMHEAPQIPNFVDRRQMPEINNVILKEGMVLAIEPMVNEGTYEVDVLANEWTVVTRDRKLSAHFEHSVLVTENGSEILTRL